MSDASQPVAHDIGRRRTWFHDWLSFAAILAALGVVGLLIVVAGSQRWFGIGNDLARSMIDSGTQVAVFTVAGALATAAVGRVAHTREVARGARDRQARILTDVVQAYNVTKAVRRQLRALGLMDPPQKLHEQQVSGIRQQMDRLTTAQLALESVRREIESTEPFSRNSEIRDHVHLLDRNVMRVLIAWETTGSEVWVGKDASKLRAREEIKRFLKGGNRPGEPDTEKDPDPAEEPQSVEAPFTLDFSNPLECLQRRVQGEMGIGAERANRECGCLDQVDAKDQPGFWRFT